MTFSGRLKFYGFGFGLGLMIVWVMFGTRSCTTPNEMKMQELVFQPFQLSEKALCKLRCLESEMIAKKYNRKHYVIKADPKTDALYLLLFKIQMRDFDVNYDISSPRKSPCGEYYVQPKKQFAGRYNYKILMLDCDSITTINDISITSSNTCTCQ